MKRFLRLCVLFSIPICIAAIAVEYLARQAPNPYRYKYEWMQQHAAEVQTLVLGSSHTYYGVRPEFLDGTAFNLANVSQRAKQDLYFLQTWGDDMRQLQTVVLSIAPFSFFLAPDLGETHEAYRLKFYRLYMHCNLYPRWSLHNLEISTMQIAFEKVRKRLAGDTDTGCDSLGWNTCNPLSTKDMRRWNDKTEAFASAKKHNVDEWKYENENYQMFAQIAAFCQERDIRLVLVLMPGWHDYYELLNPPQVEEAYRLIHRLQHTYRCDFFDYLKDPRFVPDDFFDSNHLSDVGAEKFTKILQHDLLNASRDTPFRNTDTEERQ